MKLGDFQYMFAASSARRLRGGDIGLRIFAVALAIGLWIFVNAGERGSVEQLTVPISYHSLPQGMVIVNHPPTEVKIEVTGPRTLLSLLDPGRLTLGADLREVATGPSEFKIEPTMFNIDQKHRRHQHLAGCTVAGTQWYGYPRRAGASGGSKSSRTRLHHFVSRHLTAKRHDRGAQ